MTTYSMICFGGRTGKTVTMTVANPCVITLTNHGLRDGTGVVFTSTGALPTGVVSGATYYSLSTASNTFNLYDTRANALAGGSTGRVITSGTQSGTHTVKGAFYNSLTTEQKARYGTSGNERIYSGITAMLSGLVSLLSATPDQNGSYVVEAAESYFDYITSITYLSLPCGTFDLLSVGDGVHDKTPGMGYTIIAAGTSVQVIINAYNVTTDGITYELRANNCVGITSGSLACYATVKNCIIIGSSSYTGQKGCRVSCPGSVYNNIIIGIGGNGIDIQQYVGVGTLVYNNLVTRCTGYGITQTDNGNQVLAFNNVSVSNGINYGPTPQYTATRLENNYGEPSDKKTITVNYAVNVNNITFTSHGKAANRPITFTTSGTLPTVVATGLPMVPGKIYYVYSVIDVNTIRISATSGGTVLAFSDNGTGTHYSTAIWADSGTEKYIDMTDPESVFVSWTNAPYDLRPASDASPQVDNGITVYNGIALDMMGNIRPNYNLGVSESWDGGPFEFDHGYGDPPVTLTIPGIVSGSDVVIYVAGTTTVLDSVDSISGTSWGYTYGTAQSIDIGIFKSGYVPKYIRNYPLTGIAASIPEVSQTIDRNYA